MTEFLMLQQGDMTVTEYEAEFTRLLMYGGHLVPTKLEKVEHGEREKREGKTRERSPFRKCFGTCSSGKNVRSSDPRNKGKAPAIHAPPPLVTRGSLVCYHCDQPRHIASRYPMRAKGPPTLATRPPRPPGQADRLPRPPTRSRRKRRKRLILIEPRPPRSQATHSFLSAGVAERLETGEIELRDDFTVRIPIGETLAMHGILRSVPLEICGCLLAADLIVVPIGGFDIILGIDWLMRYQAYIDCPKRTIWFMDEFGGFEFRGRGASAADPIISALKAEK
ncbi:PREDICTED: uncharacterized protein LOC104798681 [Tarenaya hassleriana]|uniref:uncharacterized protein LOC104798681 n=1 Tax=Tarenaya hassleriana TaxID=28532 RepID=UPI00053C7657|nr:PREDICTED: uncharacterized protein LOC104798681 [Tarenaya hassleriana]